LINALLITLAIISGLFLVSPNIRRQRFWKATVTPLASIIGSGFLVIVPLLSASVGAYAPLAIFGIVGFAYLVGEAIRYNIKYAEPSTTYHLPTFFKTRIDNLSDISLAFAYVISVTFYLLLLASFILHGVGIEYNSAAKAIATLILATIGIAGWKTGLGLLENMEKYSVSVKLSIIIALIVGWALHDIQQIEISSTNLLKFPELDFWSTFRTLAGLLIVVQGFETSRYLGKEYDPKTRVKSMRFAQILSGGIYIVFVALAVPTFHLLPETVSETGIIELSGVIATALPAMLIIAAIMSQFSAAVADTVGAGGLFSETIGNRFGLNENFGYLLVALMGIILIWTIDIFQVISIASQAFAIYYFLQCLLACIIALQRDNEKTRLIHACFFALLAVILLGCAIFGVPAE